MRIKGYRYAQHIYSHQCEIDHPTQARWIFALRTGCARYKKFFKVKSRVFWCPYSSSRTAATERLRALATWLMVRFGRTA